DVINPSFRPDFTERGSGSAYIDRRLRPEGLANAKRSENKHRRGTATTSFSRIHNLPPNCERSFRYPACSRDWTLARPRAAFAKFLLKWDRSLFRIPLEFRCQNHPRQAASVESAS